MRRLLVGAALLVLLAVHVSMAVGIVPCGPMTLTQCYVGSLALLGGGLFLASGACALWVGRRASCAVSAIPRVELPRGVREAADLAGVRRLVGISGNLPSAFCAGLWRTTVYASAGMARLPTGQCEAVLTHEAEHARRRDPLRRLLLRSLADVLYFVPLAGWLAGWQMERSELVADQAAINAVGRKRVADALLTVTSVPAAEVVAAYGGATDARVAQLLGDPLPPRRIPLPGLAASVLALFLSVSLGMCLGSDLIQIMFGN